MSGAQLGCFFKGASHELQTDWHAVDETTRQAQRWKASQVERSGEQRHCGANVQRTLGPFYFLGVTVWRRHRQRGRYHQVDRLKDSGKLVGK